MAKEKEKRLKVKKGRKREKKNKVWEGIGGREGRVEEGRERGGNVEERKIKAGKI